jgi:hypothetical protein
MGRGIMRQPRKIILPITAKVENMLKEEYPNSTKKERQKMMDDLVKKLYFELTGKVLKRKSSSFSGKIRAVRSSASKRDS